MRRMLPLFTLALLALASNAGAQQVGPLPDIQKGAISVFLLPVAVGLGAPDYGISPPGEANRLFVLEQKGTILVLLNGSLLPTPALDIQSLVAPPLNPGNANDERGLLGLAFHPGFNDPASVGYHTLYVYHSELIQPGAPPTFPAPNGATQNYENVVDEWKISAADPNVIDPASRRKIVSFGKNAGNHNGGTVAFGPDGYLYLGLGDGGNANDVGPSHLEPGGNAQNLTVPLGKMLRFDPVNPLLTPASPDPVSANGNYRIPAGNPFHGPGQVSEIYARGLRNPYRFSFDTASGQLIQADVGQNNIEEIDRIDIGGNYGWAVKEGDFLFDRATGNILARSPGIPDTLIDPLSGPYGTLEYDHSDGISITGGFVYHGAGIPELQGKYVFGDLAIRNAPPRVDGRLFWADLETGQMFEFHLPQFLDDKLPANVTVHGFGQDGAGELYAMVTNTPSNGTGGIVYKLLPVQPVATTLTAFVATPEAEGIRLRWRFADPGDFASVRLERSAGETVSWSAVDAGRTTVSDMSEALDRDVTPGVRYAYRLVGIAANGSETSFTPILATALERVGTVAIAGVSPNPGAGRFTVEYSLPRATEASVRLLDLQGRPVATLVSGTQPAGRHRVEWNGRVGGRVPAGLYFVELRAGGVTTSRRVALTP